MRALIKWGGLATVGCYLIVEGTVGTPLGDIGNASASCQDEAPLTLVSAAHGAGEAVVELGKASPEDVRAWWSEAFERLGVAAGSFRLGVMGEEPPEKLATWEAQAVSYEPCEPVDEGPILASQTTAACPPSGSGAEGGLSPRALRVLRCGAASFPELSSFGGVGPRGNKSDHPNGNAVDLMIPGYQSSAGQALGGRVADFYAAHAEEFGLSYLIWADRINSFDGRGWRPYKHPICGAAACGGDTLRHLDHVHVSVESGGVVA